MIIYIYIPRSVPKLRSRKAPDVVVAVGHSLGPGTCMWTEGSYSDRAPFCR
jgi:predicted dienelactone hydrolase